MGAAAALDEIWKRNLDRSPRFKTAKRFGDAYIAVTDPGQHPGNPQVNHSSPQTTLRKVQETLPAKGPGA